MPYPQHTHVSATDTLGSTSIIDIVVHKWSRLIFKAARMTPVPHVSFQPLALFSAHTTQLVRTEDTTLVLLTLFSKGTCIGNTLCIGASSTMMNATSIVQCWKNLKIIAADDIDVPRFSVK